MSAKWIWVAGLVLGIIITGLVVANTGELENVSRNFSEKSLKALTERAPIYIDGNENFNATNGVTSGNGTIDDPFIIENWVINASNANGIEIRNTNVYFIIRNCTIYNGTGIYFYNVTNGKIANCTIYNNYAGVYLSYSSNNNISTNQIYNNYMGIYLYSSSNNNIISANQIYNNSQYGIYLYSSSNNNIISANQIHNNSCGTELFSSSNNNITSCTVYNNSYGISVYSSLNNQIIDCAIYNNSYGIRTSSANNTYIKSCTILNNTNVGVDISYLTTYIINSNITGSGTKDIFLHNLTTAKVLNTTFQTVFVDSENSTLIRSWYLDVNVTDIYNNSIPYASVCVKDAHNEYIGNFSTGITGIARDIQCIAYIQNSTFIDYSMNNHGIVVGNNTQSLNMSENKEIEMQVSYFSIASPISEDVVYENYTIIQENNLTIAENGALTLKNVILKMNCTDNGSHYINVSSGAEMYILNNSNITSTDPNAHYLFWVRNGSKFEMRDSELSECGYEWGDDGNAAGLWIKAECTILENNTFSNNWAGVFFYTNYSTISNCKLYNNSVAIWLYSSSNNTIVNCNVYSNSLEGIYFLSSPNNIVTGCNAYNNSIDGIILLDSSNNFLSMCNVYNNVRGISVQYSSDSTISNCTIFSNNDAGIHIHSSENITISNCNISSNVLGGVESSKSSMVIAGTTISSNGVGSYSDKGGIWCEDNSSVTIINATVFSNQPYGIYCDASSATIINSTIINSSTFDLYLAQNSQLLSRNTNFTKTKVYFADNASVLTVSWYLHVNVLWNNSVPAEEANVRVYDKFSNEIFNNLTDDTGWLRYREIQEYTENKTAGKTYFTPHNITAWQGAFNTSKNVTVDKTMEINITLPHNAPEITDTFPDLEYSRNENTTIEFKFNISHPDNLTLTYYWYHYWYVDSMELGVEVENDTLENTSIPQELNFTYYFNYTSSGVHKIKIKISDGNATVSRTWIITVININAPPEIIGFSPAWSSMSITEEQNVTFSVTVFEADGDALSYWWYVYYENISVPVEEYGGVNGDKMIILGPFPTVGITGNYTVELNVSDNKSSITTPSFTTHTWLLKVWNTSSLQSLINNLTDNVNNLSITLNTTTADLNTIRAKLDNLTALYNNLSALLSITSLEGNYTNLTELYSALLNSIREKIENLTAQFELANQTKEEAIKAKEQAEKERDEAVNAMRQAEYKLAASVVGAVIAGIFAGAFVFSLLLRRKKGPK